MSRFNSKYISYLLIGLQTVIFIFMSLSNSEVNQLSVSIKYVIIIISALSSLMGIFVYRLIVYLCLNISGIADLEYKNAFNNLLYVLLIFNSVQAITLKLAGMDMGNRWLRFLNPGTLLTVVLLAYYLKRYENKEKTPVIVFVSILLLLHVCSQLALSYFGADQL